MTQACFLEIETEWLKTVITTLLDLCAPCTCNIHRIGVKIHRLASHRIRTPIMCSTDSSPSTDRCHCRLRNSDQDLTRTN